MTKAPNIAAEQPSALYGSDPQAPHSDMIVVGKDVLELLSSAMYVDPLTIYREYVQNAADAIDETKSAGLFASTEAGRVDIDINVGQRTVRIRDNGIGLAGKDAPARLLSIGASPKRGSGARGFRGVGRLAGLAYCRRLTFRTRSRGDSRVVELTWDCQRLKSVLRDVGQSDDLTSVIQRVVSLKLIDGADYPLHFFEVELADVVRLRNDVLLNADLVAAYLSQVAPVPFSDDLRWTEEIRTTLTDLIRMGDLQINLSGHAAPLVRPHRNLFQVSEQVADEFNDIQIIHLDGLDGDTAAVGWILHHNYLGSIARQTAVGGLRLRVGNIQVGDAAILDEIFPEARFNGWSVGEIHVLDPRIVVNARRDHFEQNLHYSNLTAQLAPVARSIAKRCRAASVSRNKAKRFVRTTENLVTDVHAGVSNDVDDLLLSHLKACVAQMKNLAKRLTNNPEDLEIIASLDILHDVIPLTKNSVGRILPTDREKRTMDKIHRSIEREGWTLAEAAQAIIRLSLLQR
jgi:molecular chaperone HtpG